MAESPTRREFLKTAAAGAAAVSLSASSYARVIGANDRISIGIIGCGSRGIDAHMTGINTHAKAMNVEITAVCDPWSVRRDMAAAKCKEWYNVDARKCVSYRDLLELDTIDAVTIASVEHQHTTQLRAVAEAKKDVYCEKPLGKDFEDLKKAVDAVKKNNVVCQVGTQLRSMASMTGARELFKTGILGKLSRVEQCRNGWRPYWYSYLKPVRQEDVDWDEFLMHLPKRPFDPNFYTGWYGYRETSDGTVPSFGAHYIDLVHYITGAEYPVSCVCLGDTYVWKDEYKFTCPDHMQATWNYPDFTVHYSTNFGNGAGNTFKIFGDQGHFDLVNWDKPMVASEGLGPDKAAVKEARPIEHINRPDHMLNWLECIRSRETPHASIDAGYQHAVAVIMAMKAFDTGHRMVYDHEKRVIRKG